MAPLVPPSHAHRPDGFRASGFAPFFPSDEGDGHALHLGRSARQPCAARCPSDEGDRLRRLDPPTGQGARPNANPSTRH